MRLSFVLSLLVAVVPALSAPTLIPITKHAGPVKENSYIIKLKEGSSKDTFLGALTKIFGESSPGSSVTYSYNDVFHGVAVSLDPSGGILPVIQGLADIEYIEPDYIMSISYEQGIDGLSTVSKRAESTIDSSACGRANPGAGVTIYIIDTGVNIAHKCFGGRATWGKTFGEGWLDADGNGHGTHTAGTAAGQGYGLAAAAKVVAVKVLSDEGSGGTSGIIAGLDWVVSASKQSKRPSVANMSLGGPSLLLKSVTEAVENASSAGVHVVVAAGNENMDASSSSPANAKSAYTVGAVDANKNNQKASFSNWGGLVDVWASGVDVKSAWIGSDTAENTISGTSMAAPHVAGILAAELSMKDQNPTQLSEALKANAEKKVKFALADIAAKLLSNKLLAVCW